MVIYIIRNRGSMRRERQPRITVYSRHDMTATKLTGKATSKFDADKLPDKILPKKVLSKSVAREREREDAEEGLEVRGAETAIEDGGGRKETGV